MFFGCMWHVFVSQNSDSGFNVRVYDWKSCRRLYSIRVCCATRLPRHPHTDPTLLASSIGKVSGISYVTLYRHTSVIHQPKCGLRVRALDVARSEEHTSELQSLMRISYAVFCLT